jgi:hypothetical protein
MSNFASPASATGIDWSTLNGRLLIIDVAEIVKDINTSFGPSDAVRATITIVDGTQPGETYTDTLVFPKVLKSQLAPNVGKQVLGRLGQGQAKPGQSAPWLLTEADDSDVKTATDFLAGRAANQLTADDI